ncbi:hypothetical protein D3C81_821860 [compost metagenome]
MDVADVFVKAILPLITYSKGSFENSKMELTALLALTDKSGSSKKFSCPSPYANDEIGDNSKDPSSIRRLSIAGTSVTILTFRDKVSGRK